ncbi:MAG TPA: DUF3105 domain-containing protein [Candidatus Limnocylindrales bacterium]|nr:DUF3105 domain-containing protein [Candidatus Limnocylindrales bacterium]
MAKRSRRPAGRAPAPSSLLPAADRDQAADDEPASSAAERRQARRERNRRAHTTRERSFFDRYGGFVLGGFTLAGIALVAFFVFLPSSGKAYSCDSLLTPGPSQSIPSYVAPTPSPSETPSPSPTESPSPTASPSASPTTSTSPTPSPSPTTTPSPSPTPEPTTRLGFVTNDMGRTHVLDANQSIEYAFCPPASGNHYNIAGVGPLPRAFYPATQEQKPGGFVHNLEHGYVVIAYSCGKDGTTCPSSEEMTAMQTVFDTAPQTAGAKACGLPNKVIVVRFDDMTTRFALLSWDRVYLTDTFDANLGLVFAEQNMDQTNPEQGVC